MAKKDVEVLDEGIKVALSDEEWMLFQKDGWGIDDELYFQKSNDFDALRILIEKSKDWRLKDVNGAWIPFERENLLGKLESLNLGEKVVLPRIPIQMQLPMANAFYYALREVRRLPNVPKSSAG